MNINKENFRDSITFLWVSAIFYLITTDVAFPLIAFLIKVIFYFAGTFMLLLSIGTMARVFKKRNIIDKDKSK